MKATRVGHFALTETRSVLPVEHATLDSSTGTMQHLVGPALKRRGKTNAQKNSLPAASLPDPLSLVSSRRCHFRHLIIFFVARPPFSCVWPSRHERDRSRPFPSIAARIRKDTPKHVKNFRQQATVPAASAAGNGSGAHPEKTGPSNLRCMNISRLPGSPSCSCRR